jgi:hypothetical protein
MELLGANPPIDGRNFVTTGFFGLIPLTVLGIFQSIKDACHDKELSDRVYATVNIISGVGSIGSSIATAAIGLTYFSSIASVVSVWAGPLSLAGSVLSSIYCVNHTISCYKTHEFYKKFKESEAPLDLVLSQSDRTLSRLFYTDGAKLRSRLSLIKNQKEEARDMLEKRLIVRRNSDVLSLMVATVSLVASIVFFTTCGTPFAPIGYTIAGISMGLNVVNFAYSTYHYFKFKSDLGKLT